MMMKLPGVKAILSALMLLTVLPSSAKTIAWENGFWFDGKSFVARSFFTENGMLATKRPEVVDQTIDLAGRYVVPAFGDAHHHGIDGDNGLDSKIAAFLRAGIFYVKNPNVIPDLLTPAVRARLNTPSSVDVVFSNGGLTATGGHPTFLHTFLASRGVFPGLEPRDMENRAYFIVDSESELDEKWAKILARKPDFIKTYLVYSGKGERFPGISENWKGLDPKVLERVVKRAHAAGLRVSTHIDTSGDFRHAVDAQVDEVSHMPLPNARRPSSDLSAFVIDAETARKAARQGTTVVATASVWGRQVATPKTQFDDSIAQMRATIRSNLRLLLDEGVRVAIGSDGISGERPFVTALDEVLFLRELDFCDNLALLKMWAENTPRTIFPNRKLGELRAGYEANFLVLEGNPLADFKQIARIWLRVKAGIPLYVDADRPPIKGLPAEK